MGFKLGAQTTKKLGNVFAAITGVTPQPERIPVRVRTTDITYQPKGPSPKGLS